MMDPADHARTILDRYWEDLLRLEPLLGTAVGDPRFDDRLPDPTSEGVHAALRVHESLIAALRPLDVQRLEPTLRITVEIANAIAADGIADATLRIDRLHHVDHLLGPVGLVGDIAAITLADTPERIDRYVTRLRAFPAYLDAVIREMLTDQANGVLWPAPIADRVVAQVRRLLETPIESTPFLAPIPKAATRARDLVARIVGRRVLPSFDRYRRAILADPSRIRPSLGLADVPHGDDIYQACIRRWTTRDPSPSVLQQLGREELARIEGQRQEILQRLGFPSASAALAAYDRQVRTALPDRASVLHLVERLVDRGWEGSKPFFLRMPAKNCVVRLVEEYREADAVGATYQAASEARDGIYSVNAAFYLDRDSRMLHRLATTSFHEANPGHHFQAALEQTPADAPALRQHVGSIRGDAFTEGWGLYAERLADEMGLFADDYERLGRLDNEALRAARLVVDTGIHAFGWSREQGLAGLIDAGLPRLEAEIEVDRYAVDPGQALCYKVGEIEIRRLRAKFAHDTAGLATFHDRLLALGALPLATVERELALLYASPSTSTGADV